MRVWLVKFEESLPIDPHPRLYRMGMLAEALLAAGHEVVWWSSTVNHGLGTPRFACDTVCTVRPGYQLRLLHTGNGRNRAVSGGRVVNSLLQAWRFHVEADRAPRPDMIVCAMPTPELAWVSSRLGRRYGVSVVVDARDMWPDVFADLLSPLVHFAARPYLALMRGMLRSATRRATGCIAITDPFLDWILGYAGRSRGATDAVFPLGYQVPAVSAADVEAAAAGLPPSPPECCNVVFLGRLNRTVLDAFDPVLDAARRLRGGGRSFRFFVAGQGDCSAALRDRSAGFEEIVFLGQLGAPALEALKRRAHVGLLCIARRKDYQISLSNKVFDYLSAGLPLASHLTGLVGDLIATERCGFVYDDGAQLAEGLRRYASEEVIRAEAARRALAAFKVRFDAQRVYPSLVQHLERLASEQGVQRA